MVNHRLFGGLLLTLVVVLSGCGQKWTAFEFENASDDELIVVESLGPLTDPPPGGVIGPGQFAGGHMGVQEVPEKLTVAWRRVEDAETEATGETNWTETELVIWNFDSFARHERLNVKYLGGGVWEATFVEPE